jgi:hypothetical protein
MKEKIVAQLKAKLATLGVKNLSNARINAIADKLSPKITDENDIDAKLDELNEIYPFADVAKDDDRLRTLESKDRKPAQQQQQQTSSTTEGSEPTKPEDETAKLLKELLNKVNSLEKDKTQTTILDSIKGNEKMKAIPASYWKGRSLPEKSEDIDGWISQVESDYTEFQQELVNNGLATATKPPVTGVKTDNVDADIKEWASKGKQTTDTKK